MEKYSDSRSYLNNSITYINFQLFYLIILSVVTNIILAPIDTSPKKIVVDEGRRGGGGGGKKKKKKKKKNLDAHNLYTFF